MLLQQALPLGWEDDVAKLAAVLDAIPRTGDLDMGAFDITNCGTVECLDIQGATATFASTVLIGTMSFNPGAGILATDPDLTFNFGSFGFSIDGNTGNITQCGNITGEGDTICTIDFGAAGVGGGLKICSGATSGLGFFGGAPIAQLLVPTITNSVTAGGSTSVVNNITAASVDTSAAKLTDTRNAIYQIALALKQVIDALRVTTGYGLFG